MRWKTVLGVVVLSSCLALVASGHPSLDWEDWDDRVRDIIRDRVSQEVDEARRVFDDVPNRLILPPTYANETHVRVSFFAYEPPEADDAMDTYDGPLNVFRAYDMTSSEEATFRQRTYHIRGDYDQTRARFQVGGVSRDLQSADNGVFDTWLTWTAPEGADNATYTVTSLEKGGETKSSLCLVDPSSEEGDMVIADVDDILKESNTNDVTDFIGNTFFRPYTAIKGMPDHMRALEAGGASFHYVTGLPIVLFTSVGEWILQEYPLGSVTMRPATELDLDLLRSGLGTGSYRTEGIIDVMDTFPSKRALVFGDTYGTSLSSFGDVIRRRGTEKVCLYLRDLGGSGHMERLAEEAGTSVEELRDHVVFYREVSELEGHPSQGGC